MLSTRGYFEIYELVQALWKQLGTLSVVKHPKDLLTSFLVSWKKPDNVRGEHLMLLWGVAWMKISQVPPSYIPLLLEFWSLSVWLVKELKNGHNEPHLLQYTPLYNSLTLRMDRTCNLLPTNTIWQRWLDAIPIIMLYCIGFYNPGQFALESCPSCWL